MHIKTTLLTLAALTLVACGAKPVPTDGEEIAARIEAAAATAVSDINEACRITPIRLESDKEARLNRTIESWQAYGNFTVAFQRDTIVGMSMYLDAVETPSYSGSDPWSHVLNFQTAFGWDIKETNSEFWRQQLQDPNRLKTLYQLLGDDLIRRGITKVGYDSILQWKADISPLLTKPVNDRLALDYGAWHSCNGEPDRCSDGARNAQLKPGHDRFVVTFKSHYGVEPTYIQGWFVGWLTRRYAEGGTPLVSAWQEVLRDAIGRVE